MRIFIIGCLALLLIAAASASAGTTRPRQDAAVIRGVIVSATPIAKMVAVDRVWANQLNVSAGKPDPFVYPAVVDAKTGAFTIAGLLPGRSYDLIVWNGPHGGDRWEGVCMDYHRPITPAGPITAEDRKWLDHFVAKVPQFFNKSRVLWVAADHHHATVLVELLRTRGFYSGHPDDIIYRTELWYFENDFGGWTKDNNTEKVITRWRGPADKITRNWQYVPGLGGIEAVSAAKAKPVHIALPEKPQAKHGLAGGVP